MKRSAVLLGVTLFLAGGLIAESAEPEKAAEPVGDLRVATFAGGCFWCMEPPFDALDGVVSTTSGYAGGRTNDPSYEEVSGGGTGHAEVVQVRYDPMRIGYAELLDVFWRNVDPIDPNGQFCDSGDPYRTAIFVHDAEQKRLAETSKGEIESAGKLPGPVVTEISPAGSFWPAEDYHQDYYLKNPVRYKFYRYGCGRDRRLDELWGKDRF